MAENDVIRYEYVELRQSVMNIDPNLLSIILGLVTNGLTSLIATSGKKARDLLIGKDFLEKWELEKTALEPLLHNAISKVAETFQWQGPATEEVLASFLLLPETQEIVRQIYSTQLDRRKKRDRLTSIQQVFLTSLTLFVNSFSNDIELSKSDLHETADFLFNLLIRECDLVLESANDKGILAAHEAKSALRHHVIASEIEAIHKKLDLLLGRESLA